MDKLMVKDGITNNFNIQHYGARAYGDTIEVMNAGADGIAIGIEWLFNPNFMLIHYWISMKWIIMIIIEIKIFSILILDIWSWWKN